MTPEEKARQKIDAGIAMRLDSTLKFDPVKEQFIDTEDANKLLRRTYREGHRATTKGVA